MSDEGVHEGHELKIMQLHAAIGLTDDSMQGLLRFLQQFPEPQFHASFCNHIDLQLHRKRFIRKTRLQLDVGTDLILLFLVGQKNLTETFLSFSRNDRRNPVVFPLVKRDVVNVVETTQQIRLDGVGVTGLSENLQQDRIRHEEEAGKH